MNPKPKFPVWSSLVEKFATLCSVRGKSYRKLMKESHFAIWDKRDDPRCRAMMGVLGRDDVSNFVIDCEMTWDDVGRPYYKVWPQMCQCMRHCSIDIPSTSLRFPYSVIEVRIPQSELPGVAASSFLIAYSDRTGIIGEWERRYGEDSTDADNDVQAAMIEQFGVSAVKEIKKRCLQSFYDKLEEAEAENGTATCQICVAYQTKNDKAGCGGCTLHRISAYQNESVEEALCRWKSAPERTPDEVSAGDLSDLLRIFVATAFFGIENHEVIMPDIRREVIEARHHKPRSKAAQKLWRDQVKREMQEFKGWRVGSEIDLPRPLVVRGECRNGVGEELKHGHVRSGHMRMQPCGKANKDRKLIFVAPTVVRPDLPFRNTHGYRIQDKLLA